MPPRLFWKAVLAYAAFASAAAAVLMLVFSQQQRQHETRELQRRLSETALVLRSELQAVFAEGSDAGLQDRLQRLERQTGIRITLIAGDGTVLGDSSEDPTLMDNHGSRPEVLHARQTGAGFAERPSATLDTPMMYYAARIGSETSPVGYVRTSAPSSTIDRHTAAARRGLIVPLIGIALAGLALLLPAVALVTRPVNRVTAAMKAATSGEPPPALDTARRDELGRLAAAFNEWNGQVSSRIAGLERKNRQLEESSGRLSTVLGGMIEGVLAVDEKERILFANKAARFMLEFTGSNVVGRPIWEAVRNPTIHEVVRNALGGTQQRSIEFELPRTGAVVALLATRLAGDPCPGVVLVLHDVTELRRLENLRREFVSNVSHELKTPLTSIQAYTETLLNGAIDDPKHNREFLQRIEDQAERLHKLILDLLRLARIETGQDVFELTAVPLGRVVQACVEEHAAVADSKKVTLTAEPPGEKIRVQADAEGLRTILDNLVDNAIKYTPEGGRVTVRWRSDGTTAQIEVEDTGTGIAPQHQSRIFERFYRADRARSRELGGTGLGLSIVKHLAQVFEGSVEVRSEVGRGSTFTIRLPLV